MWPDYQFIQDNIVITRRYEKRNKLDAFAFFKMEKFNYDFAEDSEKHMFRNKINRLIAVGEGPGQLLMLPTLTHADEAIKIWNQKSKAHDIRDFVDKYYQRQMNHLRNRYSAEYQPYLIINLYSVDLDDQISQEIKHFSGDSLKERMVNGAKDIWNRYVKTVEGSAYISLSDWLDIKNKEKSIHNRLSQYVQLERCDLKQIEWLISRNFWKGIGEPKLLSSMRDWTTSFEVEDDLYRPTRSLRFLMNGEIDFKSRHVEVNQLAGTGYQMYFTLSEIPDEGLEFPGEEFLYHALQVDLPIEFSVKWKPLKDKKVRRKIKNIRLDMDDQEEISGEFNDDQFSDVIEFEKEIKRSSDQVVLTTFSFGLYSHDLEELQRNSHTFISHMDSGNVKVVNPFGDQERGFVDFLPCTPIVLADDYQHYCFPKAIAGGMPNASMNIGDSHGIYIAWHGSLAAPVYTQYPLLPSRGMSGGAAMFGPPGSGKSVLMNLLGVETVYHGGRALFFDPKGDRTFWDRNIPGLQGRASVANFGGDEALQDRGRFDPFRLYPENLMRAMSIFTDLWSFLLDLEAGDMRVTALEESAQILRDMPIDERHTRGLLDRYEEVYQREKVTKEEYGKLVRQIRAKADHPLVGLLVGDGTEKPFTTDDLLTVIQVHGLSFPDPDAGANVELSSEQRISLASFMGIMGFAFKFLEKRNVLNFVGLDEVWSISRIAKGKQFISKLLREGRALQNLIALATQQPSDTAGMEQYLSHMFVYRQKGIQNAKDACQMLGIPDSEQNQHVVNSLPQYNCLFRDQYDRVAQIRVEITDPDLMKAFDTNPI